MAATRTPNRTLSLADLERPAYRRVLARLDALLEREPAAYLHPSKRWEYPWALERAALGAGGGRRVLDVGCGASILPVYLAATGLEVTAVDRALPPSGLGAASGVGVGYVAGDMTALPLADERFDAVFCISVIEHLPAAAIPRALAELRRVLRPGGPLLLTTDYYRDADAELWYDGPDRRFRVDWAVFDRERLERRILCASGLRVDGEIDLRVDWPDVEWRMRAFHGYPYTSIGVKLIKE
ncbi:MAG: class I SAM-dependent methyltransferase [Gemmatimonadota bacterium]